MHHMGRATVMSQTAIMGDVRHRDLLLPRTRYTVSRITTFGRAGFYWDDYACLSSYVPLGQDDCRIGVANVNPHRILSSLGFGETLVNIQHSIPNDTFVYKDAHGIVHEVEVVDRPVIPVRDLDAIAAGSSGSDTAVEGEKSLKEKARSGSDGDSNALKPAARPSSGL
ncbi:hypothetical protein AC579_6926 [Pseudocercospora musae]|uniref:Uncharacterized protein n=1 Tax=Pseudocercospora musae TaxID=113226 RepID=A0A139INM5_9PEZI|nr:hypothetical protein AC579_6926 [Pseudocercospora musae]